MTELLSLAPHTPPPLPQGPLFPYLSLRRVCVANGYMQLVRDVCVLECGN